MIQDELKRVDDGDDAMLSSVAFFLRFQLSEMLQGGMKQVILVTSQMLNIKVHQHLNSQIPMAISSGWSLWASEPGGSFREKWIPTFVKTLQRVAESSNSRPTAVQAWCICRVLVECSSLLCSFDQFVFVGHTPSQPSQPPSPLLKLDFVASFLANTFIFKNVFRCVIYHFCLHLFVASFSRI